MNRTLRLTFLLAAVLAVSRAQDLSMALSVNGSGSTSLDRGRPLIVAAVFYARSAAPVELALKDGTHWTSALQLSVEKDGAPASWPLQMVPPDEGTARLKLEGGMSAQALWLLAPENTSQLEPGRYTARLAFDKISSPPVIVEVLESPAAPTEDTEASNAVLESHYQELAGNPEAAFAAIDGLLERYSSNLRALGRKAELLSAAGRYAEAVQVYNAAIKAFAEKMPDATHPPRELLHLRNEARWQLLESR